MWPRRPGTTGAAMSERAEIGIIGGTGLYQMEGFGDAARGRDRDAVRRALRRLRARHARRAEGGVPAAARARPPHPAARAQLPGQRLGDEVARRRVDPVGLGGGLAEAAVRAAAHGDPRPVRRPHAAAQVDLLRARPRRARRLRAPVLRGAVAGAGRGLRGGGRDRSTSAAPTCAWRARSSRPAPSRSSTAPGAWTSSA